MNESKIREMDSYIQNLHQEVQHLLETKRKDKQEFIFELTAVVKRIEDLQTSNILFDKTFI
jgi:hypothetical protein